MRRHKLHPAGLRLRYKSVRPIFVPVFIGKSPRNAASKIRTYGKSWATFQNVSPRMELICPKWIITHPRQWSYRFLRSACWTALFVHFLRLVFMLPKWWINTLLCSPYMGTTMPLFVIFTSSVLNVHFITSFAPSYVSSYSKCPLRLTHFLQYSTDRFQ